jgi:hypothetical protein
VAIPQGATINSAYLIYYSKYALSGTTVNSNIYAQDADTATAPTTYGEFDGLTLTTASAAWDSVGTWTAVDSYQSSDIKTVIKEVVDRAGWTTGNNLMIVHKDDSSSDNAYRGGHSYDGGMARSSILLVDYSEASGTPTVGQKYPLPPFTLG